MISFHAEGIPMPALSKRLLAGWIKTVAADYGKKVGDIAYVFCNDQYLLEINRQYLQHDYYTDIITFDYGQGETISGDLFISIDTVRSNAEERAIDTDTELKRVMIHGILHLCGQEDKTAQAQAIMSEKEDRALLKYPRP